MAITASYAERNQAVSLTFYAATASQTVGYSDKPAEKIVLIVDNANSGTGQTATVTVVKGDYITKEAGDLVAKIGIGSQVVIGPLESTRFKNTNGKIKVNVAVTASGAVSDVKIAAIKLP